MGKTIVHQGGAGSGQHTKMVNQILISTGMIGVCEALLYGYKAGLDLPTVLQSVGSGAAGSWSLNNLGPRMIAGNFDPGFYVEHFLKDMGIALAEAKRMKLALPGLALAEQTLSGGRGSGPRAEWDARVDARPRQPLVRRLAAVGGPTRGRPTARGPSPMSNPSPFETEVVEARRPRVLVVDDHELALKSLSRLLDGLGYDTTAAKNGVSAVAAMERDPCFDFVLTDLRLPDLDGREVVQAAHRLLDSPRIALITGWDVDPQEKDQLGIDWVFQKPLDIRLIVAKLREWPVAAHPSHAIPAVPLP